MSDVASLICWDCSLVLNLGWFRQSAVPRRIVTDSGSAESDPVATAAVWKFLAEHVYHQVELAGERSPPWDHIDEDFTQIDGDLADSPTLAQYVEDGWQGRHLLPRPRPVCAAVRAVLAPLEDAMESGRWVAHPAEEAAAAELLPLAQWPAPAARRVDDAEVLARAAVVRRARDAFDRLTVSLPDDQADFPAALRAFSEALVSATAVAPEDLLRGRGELMPAALFDAERALGLIGRFLADIALARPTEPAPRAAVTEPGMPDGADVVCHVCRIVLPLLDVPVARAAWRKFLEEHAYHPVEILWEHSETWERIDIDFIQVDSDIEDDPSPAEYAGGEWTGRALALRPRPVARAVAEAVGRAQDAMDAGEWRAAPDDAAVAERILRSMDFAPSAGAVVDDAAVLARLAVVESATAELRRAAAEPVGEDFGALLSGLLLALPSVADLPPDELCAESGPLASPRLWDAERALRLIQHLLGRITIG